MHIKKKLLSILMIFFIIPIFAQERLPEKSSSAINRMNIHLSQIRLRNGQVIIVTTNSDAINGDVTNIDSLISNPGHDGISLREAIEASNNTLGPETIEFAPDLKNTVIRVGSSSKYGLTLLGGELIINGDIDNDVESDITLDGSLGDESAFPSTSTGLYIGSSNNTINGLKIVNFAWSGISLRPCYTIYPCKDRVLCGNKLIRNEISGCEGSGIEMDQWGGYWDEHANDVGWEETLISNNRISNIKIVAITLMAGNCGAKRNFSYNTTIVNNKIDSSHIGISILAGDANSEYGGNPPPIFFSDSNFVCNTIISDNIINNTIEGILIQAATWGNSYNTIKNTQILSNEINDSNYRAISVSPAIHLRKRSMCFNKILDIEINGNKITRTEVGIELGAGNYGYGEYGYIHDNSMKNLRIIDNSICDYWDSGVIIFGGLTFSSHSVRNNLVSGVTLNNNYIRSKPNYDIDQTTGIFITGGWGEGNSFVHDNVIEDVIIMENMISNNTYGIRVSGGKGGNRISSNIVKDISIENNIITEYNSPIIVVNNEDNANNNIVENLQMHSQKYIPEEFVLYQNYPNPFNFTTTIQFGLSKPAYVTLKLWNIKGEEVKTLLKAELEEGIHTLTYNCLTSNNLPLCSGIYFCILKVGSSFNTVKMVCVK